MTHAFVMHKYEMQHIAECEQKHETYTGNAIVVQDRVSNQQQSAQKSTSTSTTPLQARSASRQLNIEVSGSAQKATPRRTPHKWKQDVPARHASEIEGRLKLTHTDHERQLLRDVDAAVTAYYKQSKSSVKPKSYVSTVAYRHKHHNAELDSEMLMSRAWTAYEEVILLRSIANVCKHEYLNSVKAVRWETYVRLSADIKQLVGDGTALKTQVCCQLRLVARALGCVPTVHLTLTVVA